MKENRGLALFFAAVVALCLLQGLFNRSPAGAGRGGLGPAPECAASARFC